MEAGICREPDFAFIVTKARRTEAGLPVFADHHPGDTGQAFLRQHFLDIILQVSVSGP